MERPTHTSLIEIFDEPTALHVSLDQGIATLAVLEKSAGSSEMADALGLVHSHLQSAAEDVGLLAAIGRRTILGAE